MDAGHPKAGAAAPADEFPFRRGDAIDRFTVLEPLGMGGMGVVVSAYDCSLDRKVAIKVLRPDRLALEPEQGRTRLLREAQAMARLHHPNVIIVHEVGTIDDQVFVAMELIDGETLAGWLGREKRAWREVVRVFAQAGRGLAAAHEAGLVHRDFKPENVLVGTGGEVRVTDFGLAGVSADSPSAETAVLLAAPLTRTGAVLGTPAYMAPEQHRGDEADARSDQFSFCVALHEALYGVRPFAGENALELLRSIEAGHFRAPVREAPRWLRPLVLRGLQPQREDRWPSMDALLDALARDPSAARRRRLLRGGGAAAVAAVAVLGGIFLTREQTVPCQGAAAKVAPVWNAAARGRVRTAFLATGSPIAADVYARVEGLLARRLEGWATAHTEACQATRVRGEQSEVMLDLRMQCLERARRQVASLVDVWQRDPVDVEKAIEAASQLGEVAGCADTEALAMAVAPPRDPAAARRIDEIRAKLDAAEVRQHAGQLRPALALAEEAVAAARPLGHAPILAEALYRNGDLECSAGTLDAGLPLLYEAAQSGAEAHDDILYARSLIALLGHLADDKRLEEATTASAFARAAVARAGSRDDLVADLLRSEAVLLMAQGRNAEALAGLRRALPLAEKRLGSAHPDVARMLQNMGRCLLELGQRDEALAAYRRALSARERALGPDHPAVASSLNNLIHPLADGGELEEAGRHAERALAIREKVFPPGHPQIARSVHNLGALRQVQRRLDEARVLFERAEAMRVAALGPNHPDTALTRTNLAIIAAEQGDIATARRMLADIIQSKTALHGTDHPDVARSWRILGATLVEAEEWKEAEAAFRRSVAIWRKQSADPPELWDALAGLGEALAGQKRFVEGVAALEEARAIDEKVHGPSSRFRDDILVRLGVAYLGAGQVPRAVETLERGVALAEKDPTEVWNLPRARFELARALWAHGARPRALALARQAMASMTGPRHDRTRSRVAAWLTAHDGSGRRRSRSRD